MLADAEAEDPAVPENGRSIDTGVLADGASDTDIALDSARVVDIDEPCATETVIWMVPEMN